MLLSELMLAFCILDAWGHISVIFGTKFNNFHTRKGIEIVVCKMTFILSRPQYVNPLWPNAPIWWHRPGSMLAQATVWCMMAPGHYLTQCWLLINEILWHSPEKIFTASPQANILYKETEIWTLKITVKSARGQWVNIGLICSEARAIDLWDYSWFTVALHAEMSHNSKLSMTFPPRLPFIDWIGRKQVPQNSVVWIIWTSSVSNKGVSQMGVPLVARREPAGNQNKAIKYAICFWT